MNKDFFFSLNVRRFGCGAIILISTNTTTHNNNNNNAEKKRKTVQCVWQLFTIPLPESDLF
jgi:hypothetical protein